MLLTIVITKDEIHNLIKRRNDSAVLSHSKITGDLGACLDESIKSAMKKGWKAIKPIPTAIILPFNDSGWRQKVDAFKKKYENDVRIVFEDNLASSYLRGVGKDTENSDYVILENQGKGSELFFYKSQGNSQVSNIPEMNTDDGLKKITDYVVAEFAKEGLMLGGDQEKQLLQQISRGGKGGKYSIQKKSGGITIDASINVSKGDYEDKLTEKRSLLSKYLHPKILQGSKNLKEVILMGDYFDNQVIQDYLNKELQLSSYINKNSYISRKDIVVGASSVGFGGIEKFLGAERAEEERIANLKRKREAKHARESLLLEIRQTVVDPSKVDEYKSKFGKKADDLGIPREVVMWNIDEIVDTLELEQELGKKTEIPVISSSSVEKITRTEPIVTSTPPTPEPTPAPKPEAKKETPKPAPKPVAKKETPKPATNTGRSKASSGTQLSNVFKTKSKLGNIGFDAQVGELVHQPGEKVLRFISNSDLKNSNMKASFENLHTKESMYYENTSPIHGADFGKYYYRESVEGEPISEYVKKNAARFKSDIEKWSSQDLKLILKIWKEVTNLDHSYDLEADDIIILSKLTWSLKREMDIKLVNFKAKEISKKQMEDKMHKVLLQLFGKKIYQNLRKKFSI